MYSFLFYYDFEKCQYISCFSTAASSNYERVTRKAITTVGTPYMASEAMFAGNADAMYCT